ncbi:YncE family protein [Mucilaginibacter sp. HMF5004]|uniref:YncE family protein n=1 Tax=Mucilaginibacter rivuli TaxID=2857527 RepID=UPI001C6068C7|nr:DUF5074 domain-containing protein [Mucilaginibacter rivuli]MBW4889081.1 YncE family protein [Mucilaginibacter rivuli]
MKTSKISYLVIALGLIGTLVSCNKDKTDAPVDTPTAQRAGIYVLNEGQFPSGAGTLTYYDYTSKVLSADIFASANSRSLGTTGNDAKIYGAKMYITVDGSGTVEVVNAKTAKSIKTLSFLNGTTSLHPRSLAFYKANAFVTIYDGTVAVIDTASLTVSKYITVGRNPEQMGVSNGKLYVANSGGLSSPNVDKTVSVIDLATLTVIKTITVGDNPYAISVDSYGDVFVNAYGVYLVSNASLTIINSTTDVVTSKTDFGPGPFSISGDNAYYLSTSYSTGSAVTQVLTYNVKTKTSGTTNFITDGTNFTAAYALAADDLTGEIFVTDAKNYSSNGTIYAFDKAGKKEYSLTTGVDPGKVVFVNK